MTGARGMEDEHSLFASAGISVRPTDTLLFELPS